ncbi:FYVE [Mactra antiquata]
MADNFDYADLNFTEDDVVFWSNIEDSIDTDFWGKEGPDLEKELKKWLNVGKDNSNTEVGDADTDSEDEDDDDDDGDDDKDDDEDNDTERRETSKNILPRVVSYTHCRTSIGSPSISHHSLTEEQINRFIVENDGFPLPSTESELNEFDQQVFIEHLENSEKSSRRKKTSKTRNRQRSKSATAVPDLGTIRLKLQKLQTPGKPKFIEHLINRVVSKKVNKREENDVLENTEETPDISEEPLSPDSEKCLQQAEALVEELLTCSVRPASSESEDSGKGSSLLESTSDFSPTSKRKSWSTPASPTALHGIVKERLRGFQALQETSDTESIHSSASASHSPLQKQKSFKNEEYELELQEINQSIKQFYCSVSEDASFNSAVMESGYVKALVAKINDNKLKKDSESDKENNDEDGEGSECDDIVNGVIINGAEGNDKDDPGWEEWEKEVGGTEEDPEVETSGSSESDKVSQRSSKTSVGSNVSLRSKTSTPVASPRTSQCSARSSVSSSHENSVNSVNQSRPCSSSDNENTDEDVKPRDKLHEIALELLTTERAYVDRLHLLDQVFHFRVAMENKSGNFVPQEAVCSMFANIKPIYTFHNDFLLPQLETRMQNWSNEQKIGDIMAKLAPFLKIYTEYVKNYDTAMAMIDKYVSQSPKFASLLQEIQTSPECGQLTLQHHMLGPIQRVPRYELLLTAYLKKLEPDAVDRPDAQKALDLVTSAANHSNTAMKKLDKFNKLLNIIPRLNGEGTNDLISPTRELIKEGPITKISARSGEKQARYLFLFNDLLLVCSEQMMGSYKLRARLSVGGMEILAGDNQIIQNTFCVKCIEKTVEFLDEANNGNGLDWFATFQQVVAESQNKSKLCRVRSTEPSGSSDLESSGELSAQLLGTSAPYWVKDEEVTMCMACQDRFTALKRRHHCRACGKVFCAKCSSKKAQLQYDNNQVNRVCQKCFDILNGLSSNIQTTNGDASQSPKPIFQTKADEASVLSGYLNVMDKDKKWLRRWITARNDFALYFYKKHKDVAPTQTLPLPGHNVKPQGDTSDRPNVFTLTHKDINVCNFQAESESQYQQWVNVLQKMVMLVLPTEEEKRLSTHSDSSGQSNSSGLSNQS